MNVIVIYLGIFDLFINGYIDLIYWVVKMFDYVIVVIVYNLSK